LLELLFLILLVAGPAFLLWLFRLMASKALTPFWKHAYVRRTVDVMLVGFCVLSVVTLVPTHQDYLQQRELFGHYSEHWPSIETAAWNSKAFADRYRNLQMLTQLKWFIDHVIVFIVLPSVMVFVIGYALERRKQSQTKVG